MSHAILKDRNGRSKVTEMRVAKDFLNLISKQEANYHFKRIRAFMHLCFFISQNKISTATEYLTNSVPPSLHSKYVNNVNVIKISPFLHT